MQQLEDLGKCEVLPRILSPPFVFPQQKNEENPSLILLIVIQSIQNSLQSNERFAFS